MPDILLILFVQYLLGSLVVRDPVHGLIHEDEGHKGRKGKAEEHIDAEYHYGNDASVDKEHKDKDVHHHDEYGGGEGDESYLEGIDHRPLEAVLEKGHEGEGIYDYK